MRANIRGAEAITLFSAIVGVALAAVLAQTRVLAFGSFETMALAFLAADFGVYILMKKGVIKTPGGRADR